MTARIYKPARNAMQSGQAKTKNWVLEFDPATARNIDPLMGWTSSGDMNAQVRMGFDSREAAEKYAAEHGIEFLVLPPQARQPIIRTGGYGENFATQRRGSWTH